MRQRPGAPVAQYHARFRAASPHPPTAGRHPRQRRPGGPGADDDRPALILAPGAGSGLDYPPLRPSPRVSPGAASWAWRTAGDDLLLALRGSNAPPAGRLGAAAGVQHCIASHVGFRATDVRRAG